MSPVLRIKHLRRALKLLEENECWEAAEMVVRKIDEVQRELSPAELSFIVA